jgi:hypothetical protein
MLWLVICVIWGSIDGDDKYHQDVQAGSGRKGARGQAAVMEESALRRGAGSGSTHQATVINQTARLGHRLQKAFTSPSILHYRSTICLSTGGYANLDTCKALGQAAEAIRVISLLCYAHWLGAPRL